MKSSMIKSMTRCRSVCYCLAVGVAISSWPTAWAGWTGQMDGTGKGWAQVNVTSVTIKTNTVKTPVVPSPSDAMVVTTGYVYGGPLPSGASATTLSRVLGRPGMIWQATTRATNGDKTDNSALSNAVTASSLAASTTLEVLSLVIDTSEGNGCGPGEARYTVTWHWSGTDPGTAQRLQWYEFDGALPEGFDGDIGTLPGVILLDQRIQTFGEPSPGCEIECDPIFDETNSVSFCATADSNKVYTVTDGIAVSVSPFCPGPLNRDINSYVLFALDEMMIKDGAQILGGNVGVNGAGPFGGSPRLRFGGTAFMSDGKQAVGDTARLTSGANVDQLFVNALSGNPPVDPRSCDPTPFDCIDPAHNACITTNTPTCPPCSPGSNNVTVASSATLNLPPGSYGDIRVNDKGVLNLGAGVYCVRSLSLGKFVKVMTTDQTEVRVAQNVFMNSNPFIGPACGAKFCIRSEGINNGNSVGFSSNGTIYGQWVVPNGRVDLGGGTVISGRIWARSFGGDPNVSITFCTPTIGR